MTSIPRSAVEQLRRSVEEPDLRGTRYVLLEKIGEGGMGSVWAARDEQLGRRVAIKVVRGIEPSAEAGERLAREAATIAHLEHPSVVPIYDAGRLPDGRNYYAMKLIEGRTLARWAEDGAPPKDRLRMFARLCEAVAFVHARGVVHRDLKPDNVMVGAFGELYVMDWGIAKVSFAADAEPADSAAPSGRGTAHGAVLGTPEYMAPEQARGEASSADARADVYSLGAILLFLMRAGGGSSPRALRDVAARAMADAPSDRYTSALDLARDVVRFLDGERPSAHREWPWETAARFVSRNAFLVGLITAYLVLRAGILLFSGR